MSTNLRSSGRCDSRCGFEVESIMYIDGGGCGVCRAGYADERCWQGLYFSLQYPHHSVKIVFLLLYFSAVL